MKEDGPTCFCVLGTIWPTVCYGEKHMTAAVKESCMHTGCTCTWPRPYEEWLCGHIYVTCWWCQSTTAGSQSLFQPGLDDIYQETGRFHLSWQHKGRQKGACIVILNQWVSREQDPKIFKQLVAFSELGMEPQPQPNHIHIAADFSGTR